MTRAPFVTALVLLLFPALVGCPRNPSHTTSPQPQVTGVGVLSVQTTPAGEAPPPTGVSAPSERQARARVLDAAAPKVLPCYQAAIQRNPFAYGEIVVRYSLNEDGSIRELQTILDTVGDEELIGCVEGVVREIRLPKPSRPNTRDDYPFLFTTDRTPPEVVRALKARHGLVPKDDPSATDPGDPNRKAPAGTVETW